MENDTLTQEEIQYSTKLANYFYFKKVARGYKPNRLDYDDILQDVRVGMLQGIKVFKPEKGHRGSWLWHAAQWTMDTIFNGTIPQSYWYNTTKTVCQSELEDERNLTTHEVLELYGHTLPETKRIEARLLCNQLLTCLKPSWRKVFVLRYTTDMGLPEIAAACGYAEKAGAQIVSEILKTGRERMRAYGYNMGIKSYRDATA